MSTTLKRLSTNRFAFSLSKSKAVLPHSFFVAHSDGVFKRTDPLNSKSEHGPPIKQNEESETDGGAQLRIGATENHH